MKNFGICKHCHKNICEDNAINTGWGFVCSEDCAKELSVIQTIVSANYKAISESRSVKEVYISNLQTNIKFHSSLLVTWILALCFSLARSFHYGNTDYAITFSFIFMILILASIIKIKITKNAIKAYT